MSIYGGGGSLSAGMYDGRDDFGFPVAGFPFLCGGVPSSPAYGVFVSQLIRCCGACGDYRDFLCRCRLLAAGLVSQGCRTPRLGACLKEFYGRCRHLIDHCEISVSGIIGGLSLDQ